MIHHLVAITGGIGAGKSIVSRVLRAKGYQVYDCDSRARAIMDSDPEIKTRLRAEIHPKALRPDGTIDRRLIASVVFTDPDRLAALNRLVHPAVERDFEHWAAQWARHPSPPPYIVEEAAILIESGAHRLMDRIVTVTAPEPIRLQRIIQRDRTTPTAARARISAQLSDPQRASYADFTLTADDRQLLIPQVLALHTTLCRETAAIRD